MIRRGISQLLATLIILTITFGVAAAVALIVSDVIRSQKPGAGGELVLYDLKAYTEGSYLYIEGRGLYQGDRAYTDQG